MRNDFFEISKVPTKKARIVERLKAIDFFNSGRFVFLTAILKNGNR